MASKLSKSVSDHNDRLDRIQRRLRESPERMQITLGRESFEFLLSKHGISMAAARGHDPLPHIFNMVLTVITGQQIYDRISALAASGKALPDNDTLVSDYIIPAFTKISDTKILDALSVVVWSGLLPFEPDLLLEEVDVMLTPSAIMREVPKIIGRVMEYAAEVAPSDGEDSESVNGDGSTEPVLDVGGLEGNLQ